MNDLLISLIVMIGLFLLGILFITYGVFLRKYYEKIVKKNIKKRKSNNSLKSRLSLLFKYPLALSTDKEYILTYYKLTPKSSINLGLMLIVLGLIIILSLFK